MNALLALLAARGHDFRDYRRDVLSRRVQERMEAIGVDDLDAYVSRVASAPDEVEALVETLLVTTSHFFRDPATFEALEHVVLPSLARTANRPLRVWVAGAAQGEEAWSLAMILEEIAPYEIHASDASARAIDRARRARYPIVAAGEIPPRFHKHVFLDRTDLVIDGPVREHVRFSVHDLLGLQLAPRDAVLARFDLVLCRNVLIYLEERLQERLIDRLSSVLAPGGVLGIGPYEHLTAASERVLERVPEVRRALNLFRRRP